MTTVCRITSKITRNAVWCIHCIVLCCQQWSGNSGRRSSRSCSELKLVTCTVVHLRPVHAVQAWAIVLPAWRSAGCHRLSCVSAVTLRQRPHRGVLSYSGSSTLGPGGTGSSKSWLAHKFSRPPKLWLATRSPRANLAVLLAHCGQLILSKISKYDTTRYQILRLKCTKFAAARAPPRTLLGELTALPTPLAVFKGPTSTGRK